MAQKTATSKARRFVYNGMELPDPSPEGAPLTVKEVKDAYAGTYPELATANVKGPTNDGDVEVYTFTQNVGVKG